MISSFREIKYSFVNIGKEWNMNVTFKLHNKRAQKSLTLRFTHLM